MVISTVTLIESGLEVSTSIVNHHGPQLTKCPLVLGYSSDLLPYVGEVPNKPGVFICAGFTGHGEP